MSKIQIPNSKIQRSTKLQASIPTNSSGTLAAFKRNTLIVVLLVAFALGAMAHEVRPAYLELRQTGPETYDALWKVPGRGENLRLGLYVELPGGCTNTMAPRASMVNSAFTERWSFRCPGGLTGQKIHIAGLGSTATDVLLRLERVDGTTQTMRLTPSVTSFVVEAAPRRLEVAGTYSVLGVEHILTGIDHLLFVLALIIITGGGWKLVKTVTAFTVSHSITLTLATLGYIHVPQKPVEALIALSIVFVASEIVRHRSFGVRQSSGALKREMTHSKAPEDWRTPGSRGDVGGPSLTYRAPWIVAFSFGLMHGLGFASGLSEAGLPQGHIPTALLFFSIGVEGGHFLFIGVVLLLITVWRGASARWQVATGEGRVASGREQVAGGLFGLITPYAIGGVAMFWVIQRIAAF